MARGRFEFLWRNFRLSYDESNGKGQDKLEIILVEEHFLSPFDVLVAVKSQGHSKTINISNFPIKLNKEKIKEALEYLINNVSNLKLDKAKPQPIYYTKYGTLPNYYSK